MDSLYGTTGIDLASPQGRALFLCVFLLASFAAGMVLPGYRRRLPLFWSLAAGAASELARRLDREKRSPVTRMVRGVVVCLLILVSGYMIGVLMENRPFTNLFGWVPGFLLMAVCVNAYMPVRLLTQTKSLLQHDDLKRAAGVMQPLVRQDMLRMDRHGVIRTGLELSAWSLNRLLVGPVFWFMLIGVPGVALYISAAAVDHAIGGGDRKRNVFGWSAGVIDDILDFFPSRLTGVLVVLSAVFTPTARPRAAFASFLKHGRAYAGLNAGWPVAAMAGAVGVTLGGPAGYADGTSAEYPWVGPADATARAEPAHLKRATGLIIVCFMLLLALACLPLII